MAERPIFVPSRKATELVEEINFHILWHSGFAAIQKKRNIAALHEAAAAAGYAPLLETSTKSDEKLGQHLSAFHLKVHSDKLGDIPLECAYQGSKVFERGGPYTDLFMSTPERQSATRGFKTLAGSPPLFLTASALPLSRKRHSTTGFMSMQSFPIGSG